MIASCDICGERLDIHGNTVVCPECGTVYYQEEEISLSEIVGTPVLMGAATAIITGIASANLPMAEDTPDVRLKKISTLTTTFLTVSLLGIISRLA